MKDGSRSGGEFNSPYWKKWLFASPVSLFWKNGAGFLTSKLFKPYFLDFFSLAQKRRIFMRRFCCASFLSTHFGPSGETRTPGILLPKQARYQLRYTRILSFPTVVKHVVNIGFWPVTIEGKNTIVLCIPRASGLSKCCGPLPCLLLPKQARYQLRYTPKPYIFTGRLFPQLSLSLLYYTHFPLNVKCLNICDDISL